MKQNDRRIGVSDILLFVFSVVELIGIRTFFAPCGPKEDGSWIANRLVYEADEDMVGFYKGKATQSRRRSRGHGQRRNRSAGKVISD